MKKVIEDVVIIGGGPAGAYLGYLLGKNGMRPLIFDYSHPREKPCGGGISVLAIEKFPILSEIPDPKEPSNDLELISAKGISVMTFGEKDSWTLSRKKMDKFILDKSIEAGVKLIEEQVIDINQVDNIWHIKTKKGEYKSKIIIGADGVDSIVRKKILGPIPQKDLGICYGCFAVSDKKEQSCIKFLENKQGYAWCFPGHDHLSIGIGVESSNKKDVKKIFNDFLSTYYPNINIQSNWGAKIPNIKNQDFYDLPCAGEDWILIGDAAGHVDSITGEGITYALWSAELASKAILNNNPKSFDELWRKEYGDILLENCKMRSTFYNPHLLELSMKIATKSETLSKILNERITNQFPQHELMKRLIWNLPVIIKEYVYSKL